MSREIEGIFRMNGCEPAGLILGLSLGVGFTCLIVAGVAAARGRGWPLLAAQPDPIPEAVKAVEDSIAMSVAVTSINDPALQLHYDANWLKNDWLKDAAAKPKPKRPLKNRKKRRG